ncbi:unnamed protein product [Miscanthus lutarioriparius]|uniref:Uncharacterized protein n=1 Tax=Miscanthus lutarioriparius TaxID=422564 RepID=A0A811RYP9_9POAL|nr:unnamed protein product [Miscanthus lutarioriparius]
MFPDAVDQPMAGSCSVAPAGTDQLDLEAAEQLIQLSGGDSAAAGDNDAGSESRSADSVKCGRKEKEKEKEKEAAVESRRRRSAGRIPAAGKDDGSASGDSEIKGVDSFAACSATAADVVEKEKVVVVESCRRRTAAAERCPAGKKDRDGGIVRGEARKRPRFRLLADIYRDTEPRRLTAGGGEGHADRDPPEGERKKEIKRARPTR